MDERTAPALPKEMNERYEETIRKNLTELMRQRGISQSQLAQILEQRGLALSQGNMSLILSGKKHFPLSLVVHLCGHFGVSLEELVDENFGSAREAAAPMPQVYSDELLNLLPSLGDSFITDPNSPEFQGYLQTYHVYMKPTQTFVQQLQIGQLVLEASGGVCEATLSMNCSEKVDGEYVCKQYHGRAIISTSVDAVYVLLTSPIEGELSLISFRHSHRPHQPLNCRIAAVLTNEAGEFHAPTVHRMFLSRVPIAEEHHPLLIPHLFLNDRGIAIRADALDLLKQQHSEYVPMLEHLAQFKPIPTYYWTEEYVKGIGRFLLSGHQLYMLLTMLRGISEAPYQNKASHTADMQIRNLLLMLGYYGD